LRAGLGVERIERCPDEQIQNEQRGELIEAPGKPVRCQTPQQQ
jgi:hypothetical protein